MNKIFANILFWGISIVQMNICLGAFEHVPLSTMGLSTGRIVELPVVHPVDVMTHPALLANPSERAEVLWGRLFNQPNLNYGYCAGVMSTPFANMGVLGGTFGNQIYRETIFAFSVGKSWKEKLQFGTTVSVYHLQIGKYGSAQTFGLNVSWRYVIVDKFVWSTRLKNINAPTLGVNGDRLSQNISTGISTTLHERIFASVEWAHDLDFERSLNFGIIYFPLKNIGISSGFCSFPTEITAGLFFRKNRLYIEYAASINQKIYRISQQISLGLSFPR